MPTPRNALSANFIDVYNAVNGGGPFAGVAPAGTVIRLPPGPMVTWGPTDVLQVSQDISIIGAGADYGQVTPRDGFSTKIKTTHPNGIGINMNFQGSPNACRLSGIVFEVTQAGPGALIVLRGKCYRRRASGVVVGGLRVDNLRFRNFLESAPYNAGANARIIEWGGPVSGSGAGYFVTGSFDHNFFDYQTATQGAEINSWSCAGSPDGTSDGWGQWGWQQDYIYGEGDDDPLDSGLNVIYIEDNIFHRKGHNFGTLQGGGRIILRYNTGHGSLNGHGIDAGNMGPASWETYNNWCDDRGTLSLSCLNARGGASVFFNNRVTSVHGALSANTYRERSGVSLTIGPATGRNFLDKNYSGPITFNGANFTPQTPDPSTTDSRIGSKYAHGTLSVEPTVATGGGLQITLTGLDEHLGPVDKWKDFVITNVSLAGDGSDGDQGRNAIRTSQIAADGRSSGQLQGYITGSTAANPCVLTVVKGGESYFNIRSGDAWEIRRIERYFCNPGSGKCLGPTSGDRNDSDTANSGRGTDLGGFHFTAALALKHKYWSSQVALGMWSWENLSRIRASGAGSTWSALTNPSALPIQGAWHNTRQTHNRNDGTGTLYPVSPLGNTADTLRVGAHWQAPGNDPLTNQLWDEGMNQGDADAPTTAYGAVYPNVMTGAATATPQISSLDHASFIQGTGGTFSPSYSGFSAAPTWSHSGGTFPASGTTLNATTGVLTVGAGSAAGVYTFTLTATNGSESDSQSFTLTITAAATKIISLSGSLSFGNCDVNTTKLLSFTIQNTGNTDLTVTNVTLPTGFTSDFTSGTIGPNASQLVAVTFAPLAGISYSGNVTVVSDKTSGTNTIAASGTGITRVIALSGSLAFGSITVGQTATLPLTITNNGNGAMTVSAVAYPEGFSGDYAGSTIAAGASVTDHVTFSPVSAIAYSGSISLTSNKTSGTASASASGTGTASATKVIQLTGSLAYGSVQTGTTLSKALTITNSGTATLTVTDVTVPTGYTPDWTSGTIAAGASQVVNITFAPVAVTSYNGTVTVSSDATSGTSTHAISGVGVAASTKIIGLSGNMAFGNVTIGSTNARTLTIANSGSAVLTVTSITLPTGFSGSFSGTIAAGASQDVTITFSPLAAQLYSGTITVQSDKTSGTAAISVSGTGVVPVTRIIGLSGDLAFGNVVKNHNTQRNLTITNGGTTALTITSITYPTAFTGDFASGDIAPGASQVVVVTFRPTAAQSYGGTITVASNKTSGINTIPCSGTGVNKKQVPFVLIVG